MFPFDYFASYKDKEERANHIFIYFCQTQKVVEQAPHIVCESLYIVRHEQQSIVDVIQIVCKHQNLELVLDCNKLQLNLFRMLKLLNEVNLLPILFPQHNPPEKLDKSNETQPVKQTQTKKYHQHQITVIQAMNLIWYSAHLCKSGAIVPYQMNKMGKNKSVGQKNLLRQYIEATEVKIKHMMKKKTQESNEVKQVKAKLKRLVQIQQIVNGKWAKLKQVQMTQLLLNPKNTNIGFFSSEISPQQKQILATFSRKSLLKWDIQILIQSIMFVQELQTGHCIVSLQQCYPSFMVYKELLKCLIGQEHYNKGVKQMLLRKEQNFKQGRPFVPSKYVMCHLCKKIELRGQIQKNQNGKICEFQREQPTIYQSAYAYDEIIMRTNYHRLPLKPLSETEVKQCYEQTKQYPKYVHPYIKVYYPKCQRYFCQLCLQKKEESKEKDSQRNKKESQSNKQQLDKSKSKQSKQAKSEKEKDRIYSETKHKSCILCSGECSCDRCAKAQNFKKLLAFYKAIGGSFQDLAPQLMFLNFYCTRVHIQLVTFQKQFQREEENSQENRVELQKDDEETLSYPEQVSKLEGWFTKLRDKQRVKLYGQQSVYNYGSYGNDECESVDENQIFPELQQMFDKLLKDQEQQEEELQVKILEQQDRKSVQSKRSKSARSSEEYFQDESD